MSNKNCNDCDFCNDCKNCNSCYHCKYCKNCNSCYYCNDCYHCRGCENLVNGWMCSNIKLSKKDKNKYWMFNKEVSKEEWDKRYELGYEEKKKVCDKCGAELKEVEDE